MYLTAGLAENQKCSTKNLCALLLGRILNVWSVKRFGYSVLPDLGPNCLQRSMAGEKDTAGEERKG